MRRRGPAIRGRIARARAAAYGARRPYNRRMTRLRNAGRISANWLIIIAAFAAAAGLWLGMRVLAPARGPALATVVMYPAPRELPAFELDRSDAGKLRLDDPIAKYIPSFAKVKVGVEKKAENGQSTLDLVPVNRPVTVFDLMTQTSGITYGFYGGGLVRKAYTDAKIYDGDFDNAEFAERIAKLPLKEQPGTLWDYGHSTDILGRIIEVVSGKSLLQFEKDALLDPLGMKDTTFYVTDPAKQKRIAMPVPNDSDFRVGFVSSASVPAKWESGGGGMVTTMADFAKFSQMLLNGGSLGGKQYLSPKAFKEMTTDKIGPNSGVDRDYFYFPGDGFGYGLGIAVRTDPGNAKPPPPGDLGELKWDGASGCYFVIDPKQDMFFVLLEQTPSERQKIQPALKKLIYEALEN